MSSAPAPSDSTLGPRPAGSSDHADSADPNRWWTLVAVCLGTFMLLVDITIINVALPDIQKQLDASFSDLQWIIDAYALTLASLLLTMGSLADLYGRRRLYMVGLGVFTFASLLCGLAVNPLMLILSRGFQGVGGAVMFSVSLALLAGAFSGRERGVAFGVWGAITGLAVAIGPLLGGGLTSGLSWRWIFFVNLPLGLVAVALTRAKVQESVQPGARRPDWAGFVTFTAALSLLVFGLIRSGEQGWSSAQVYGCFLVAAVLLLAFVGVEARGRTPMFDLALFRLPTFVGGSIVAFSLSASLFALQLYFVLYLQDVLGYSAFGTGLRLLVLSGGILLTSTLAGRLTSHVPVRLLIGPGLVLVGAGLLLMRRLDASSDWTVLIPGLFVAGAGTGLVNPPLASTAVGVVHPSRSGMASGINSTFRQVGIATGIATFGSLFASAVSDQVERGLQGAPPQAASGLASAVKNGAGAQAIGALPESLRPLAAQVARESFVFGLRQIVLIGAIVALVGGVLALLLIRRKDFAAAGAGVPGATSPTPAPAMPDVGDDASHTSSDLRRVSDRPRAPVDDSAGAASGTPVSVTDERPDQHRRDDPLEMPAPGASGGSSPAVASGGPAAIGSAAAGPPSPSAGRDSVLHGSVEHMDGRPFEGVPLTLTTGDGDSVALLHSDPEGRFSVPVEPGSYVVIASPSGCQPDARRVQVPDGALGEPANFVLDGDGLLYGRVRGATTGVVTVLDAEGSVVAVTDVADGEYEVAGLRSGAYTVTAVVPGAAPTASQVDVPSGDALEFDLDIGPADFSVPGPPEPVPAGEPSRAPTGPFGPGLHPVALVRGGTGITGLPGAAPATGKGARPEPDGFAGADSREQDS